jgi:hypothetical protein
MAIQKAAIGTAKAQMNVHEAEKEIEMDVGSAIPTMRFST